MHRIKNCGLNPKIDFFRALACQKRLTILELLENEKLNVNDLSDKLHLDKSVVSRHLAVLRQANLISYEKEGLNVYYKVIDIKLYKILQDITNFLKSVNQAKIDNM